MTGLRPEQRAEFGSESDPAGKGERAKHTPTPWEKRGFGLYVPGTQKRVADVPIAWKTSAEADATAAFIVKACNTHDELVAALRKIAELSDSEADEPLDDAIRIARAALERAKL